MKLTATDISFSYGNKRILENVNLELNVGETIGLVAPSGFGKTTLARILSGYETSYRGTVKLDFRREDKYNPVQLIFQHPEHSVDPKWTMRRTLEESWIPSQKLLDSIGIKEEWMSRYPNELSGGEIQRFCVIRALNPKTKFLIADEMTTMLDAITTAQIWNVVKQRVSDKEIGLLVISHERKLLDYICDKVVALG